MDTAVYDKDDGSDFRHLSFALFAFCCTPLHPTHPAHYLLLLCCALLLFFVPLSKPQPTILVYILNASALEAQIFAVRA